MNTQKLTQKSLEAISLSENVCNENANTSIEPIHLTYSLFTQENGLIPSLLEKMGINPNLAQTLSYEYISKLPKAYSSQREQGKIYISQSLDRVFADAESKAKSFNDEYISVEHLFLALLDCNENNLKELFKRLSLDKNNCLTALKEVRSSNRVTSDNPEATYKSLKK